MLQRRHFLTRLAAAGWATASAGAAVGAAPGPAPTTAPALPLSDCTRELARRVTASGDNARRPFAIVDKRAAMLAVFAADGAPAGATRALLGQARGDHSLPGVGERTQQGTLRPQDRTTPAGRFRAQPGFNRSGEAIVWLDWSAAFALHRLRPGPRHADRARRLASARTTDKRASDGCVVVPEVFFDDTVHALLGRQRGVVYVLPERTASLRERPWQALWRDISDPAAA